MLKSGDGEHPLRIERFAVVGRDGLAAASSARLVYSAKSGKLFYNSNGSRSGFGLGEHGEAFAILNHHPNLTAADFSIMS